MKKYPVYKVKYIHDFQNSTQNFITSFSFINELHKLNNFKFPSNVESSFRIFCDWTPKWSFLAAAFSDVTEGTLKF